MDLVFIYVSALILVSKPLPPNASNVTTGATPCFRVGISYLSSRSLGLNLAVFLIPLELIFKPGTGF
jgi:hypothetical protein